MSARLNLFEAFGIELEYMIVDRRTLAVRPISDEVLRAAAGEIVSEVEMGEVSWSNELMLHVLELKTSGPAPSLEPLPAAFDAAVEHVNRILAPLDACLLPSAMHPWMDPSTDAKLWPHEYNAVYAAFDRIFDCRGHGWSNLQSMHVNLPFGDDEEPDGEFGRLHAAIRLVLPILPALAASSPVVEGKVTGIADSRLHVYARNSRRIPSISGQVVPEPVYTRADYEKLILGRIYADVAPFDPEGTLRHEWCNARGAIARFDRHAIEIRVLDVQECPLADLAIAKLVTAAVRALVEERWADRRTQQSFATEPLAAILHRTIEFAERTPIEDARYLELFGLRGRESCSAGDLWQHVREQVLPSKSPEDPWLWLPALDVILDGGTLSTRILGALGPNPSREELQAVYSELAECLARGRQFLS